MGYEAIEGQPVWPNDSGARVEFPHPYRYSGYSYFRRAVDISIAVLVFPIMLGTAITLLFLNPLVNPGPVFFRQKRMGINGKPFSIWKFRTMIPCDKSRRSDGEVEKDRITPLGKILRHHRLDELPNFINVLRGEMSLIGPRPEMWDHAIEFIDLVPHYRERFCVLPGVTGLAQVRYGYADNSFSLRVKAKYDSIYVQKVGLRMDVYVLIRTVQVVLSGHGAK